MRFVIGAVYSRGVWGMLGKKKVGGNERIFGGFSGERNKSCRASSRAGMIGQAALWRPRLTGAAASFAFHLGVERSGASSGSNQTALVGFLLARIGFSHADVVACHAILLHQFHFPTDDTWPFFD